MRHDRSLWLGVHLGWLLLSSSGRVSHQVSPSTDAAAMDRRQVVQLLIHQGYRDIRQLHRNGEDWIGVGTKHGQLLNFDVDKTGYINPVSPQSNP